MAGGSGTRLGNLTRWHAKPALTFGGQYRNIDFSLSNCVNSGIRQIGVATQYKSHSLIQHLQRGWQFFRPELGESLELWPAQQRLNQDWYAGTADAVFQNLDIMRDHAPEYVLVLAGDHIYKMDYEPMLRWHVHKKADVTVGCTEIPVRDASQFGIMEVDLRSHVRRFTEKPSAPKCVPGKLNSALASMGIYVFKFSVLMDALLADSKNPRSDHDFGRDIIPLILNNGRVVAHEFRDSQGAQAYWRDVGTLNSYWSAHMDLLGTKPALNLHDDDWPIWTYQPQLPPARFCSDLQGTCGTALDSIVSSGCLVNGGLVRHSVLSPSVHVNSCSVIDDSVVLPGAQIGRHCRLQKVIVEAGCIVPDRLEVGYDQFQDSQRFEVSPGHGHVTLITSEMLQHLEDSTPQRQEQVA